MCVVQEPAEDQLARGGTGREVAAKRERESLVSSGVGAGPRLWRMPGGWRIFHLRLVTSVWGEAAATHWIYTKLQYTILFPRWSSPSFLILYLVFSLGYPPLSFLSYSLFSLFPRWFSPFLFILYSSFSLFFRLFSVPFLCYSLFSLFSRLSSPSFPILFCILFSSLCYPLLSFLA